MADTGIVTIQCSQTGENHPQQLVEGSLDWAAVEKAFSAEVVELEGSGTPLLYRTGDRTGYTRQTFTPNVIIKVKVTKKGEHESTAVGSRTCTAFFRGCQPRPDSQLPGPAAAVFHYLAKTLQHL